LSRLTEKGDAVVVHGRWSIRAPLPSSPLRSEETEGRVADNLLDGSVVLRGNDPTLAWYADASRVDQVAGDAVYRAARGRQSDLP
jgi:hypothetical protein